MVDDSAGTHGAPQGSRRGQRIRGEGEIGEGGAGHGWTAVDGGGPECIEGGRLLVDGA